MRAAVYCRISDDADGTGLGVDRQRKDCEALIAGRGWDVAGVYTDNDISAYTGKVRPAYRRLLGDIRSGDVDAVVAWHPDRLHRTPRELEEFITIVEKAGTRVESVTAGSIDLSTPSGRAVARTLGAWARFESEHKAERIVRKHAELAEAGVPVLGGTRCFGYRRVDGPNGKPLKPGRLEIVPSEATLIRDAAQRILAGDSIRGIAADWNRCGIATTTGGRWRPSSLRRLLLSARIAGIRDLHGVVSEGTWPAIIDRMTHDRLRSLLRDGRRRSSLAGTARRYLLAGMLRCSVCGHVLVSRPRVDHVRRYVCSSGPATGGCGKIAIGAEPLEELIAEAAILRLSSPEFRAVQAQQADDHSSDDVASLSRDEARLEELARDYYVERVITRAEYVAARHALSERIADARRQLATSSQSVLGALASDVRGLWQSASFDRRRAILGELIETITIAPGRRGFNRFDASRVDVAWRF
jgi:DNA invertase Pin-like site-specific DNA recombinase